MKILNLFPNNNLRQLDRVSKSNPSVKVCECLTMSPYYVLNPDVFQPIDGKQSLHL